jgi:hypothetical protein
MAKKTKAAGKRDRTRDRRERRFEPLSISTARVVYPLGALGAMLMGAGAWGQFGAMVHEGGPEPLKFAPYILAAGAVLVGVAIWMGTSAEPPLRVGSGGVAVEKGGLRRMPWHAVERIEWRDEIVWVTGRDDLGAELHVGASLKSQPQAAAWIVKEARERIPSVTDVPVDASLPEPLASAGAVLALDPPQVVGKHCASSGKVIAYEPDARLCPRCERVYHRTSVPDTCECGASLADVRETAHPA